MSTSSHESPRAYRRGGRLILEIDEHRFTADAISAGGCRILDRSAFLAFACENFFGLLHDDDAEAGQPTWWNRLAQALCAEAAERGAGVIPDDGSAVLPIDQPPDLFSDDEIRRLLGAHVKETAA